MKRFASAVLFAVALAAIAAAGQVTLRLGNNQPETQVWNVGIRQFQAAAARLSGGRLEIVNYPNATLGA